MGRSTFQRLCELMQYYEINSEIPCLTRTFSNYGFLENEFDPLWSAEFSLLKSLAKKDDLKMYQIEQDKIQTRPAFYKLLVSMINHKITDELIQEFKNTCLQDIVPDLTILKFQELS